MKFILVLQVEQKSSRHYDQSNEKDAQEIDMIKDPDKILQTEFSEDDICLIAVPSYGGRIPSVTVDKFQKLQAKGTKAILVAVFGNRAIDDTLVEMQDILENAGFVCVVGVEAVAEHSLMHQFGTDGQINRMRKN